MCFEPFRAFSSRSAQVFPFNLLLHPRFCSRETECQQSGVQNGPDSHSVWMNALVGFVPVVCRWQRKGRIINLSGDGQTGPGDLSALLSVPARLVAVSLVHFCRNSSPASHLMSKLERWAEFGIWIQFTISRLSSPEAHENWVQCAGADIIPVRGVHQINTRVWI